MNENDLFPPVFGEPAPQKEKEPQKEKKPQKEAIKKKLPKVACLICTEAFNKTMRTPFRCPVPTCDSNKSDKHCISCVINFYNSEDSQTVSHILPKCTECMNELPLRYALSNILFPKNVYNILPIVAEARNSLLARMRNGTLTRANFRIAECREAAAIHQKARLIMLEIKLVNSHIAKNTFQAQILKLRGNIVYRPSEAITISNETLKYVNEVPGLMEAIYPSQEQMCINVCIAEYINLSNLIERIYASADRDQRAIVRNANNNKAKTSIGASRCRVNGCIGMMGSSDTLNILKCMACDSLLCNKCERQVNTGQPGNPDHVCVNEDIVEVEAIRLSTKQCPACGVRISKTEGCNHMFCTNCKTCFDWVTMKQQRSNTNPHFYEHRNRERENSILRGDSESAVEEPFEAIRVAGEDGLTARERMAILKNMLANIDMFRLSHIVGTNRISETIHAFGNIAHEILPQNDIYMDTALKYLLNDISEDQWKFTNFANDFSHFFATNYVKIIVECYHSIFSAAASAYNKASDVPNNANIREWRSSCELGAIESIVEACENADSAIRSLCSLGAIGFPVKDHNREPDQFRSDFFQTRPSSKRCKIGIDAMNSAPTDRLAAERGWNSIVQMTRASKNYSANRFRSSLNYVIAY